MNRENNMNVGLAKVYIGIFCYMRKGKQYKRTISGFATKYYLQNIYYDYGFAELQTALKSVDLHIRYVESLEDGRINNIKIIYNEFINIQESNNNYNENNDENEEGRTEGKVKRVLVNKYERDQRARKKCIEYYGYRCNACGLLLKDIYGEIAEHFIHVYHIKELSSIGEEYVVNPIKDLRPLCPNCHLIIHRKSPALEIEELVEIINNIRNII